MSTVCAIILDYFGSSKTIACLTSLLDQGLDSVVVVDNSGDRQANIQLQEALTEFRRRELPFTIHQIVNPKNLGYAAGVNNALRWLEKNNPHQYYLLINNDANATPGMLPELLKFMRGHDRTAITAPMISMGQKEIAYSWYHRFTGLMFSHHIIGAFPYLTGCCLLVDQQIVNCGLFDEDFFMYGEDVELCWRLRLSGWNISCVKEATVLHEGVGSSFQGGNFYEYYMARGHILLARKLNKRRWGMPFLYIGRLLTLSARAVLRSIRFRSMIPITGWISALRKHNVFNP
ncbi:MAG: glycosyltransferase family 2 protein [Desulfotomaculaceae bacterium]|nr:glycosyltransferase family 2 protein [Desulfotomaculaceae bacterium]